MENTTDTRKSDHDTKPSQLFLVRIWPDGESDGKGEWGGKIQHVLTGESRHFENWAGLGALLQSMLPNAEQSKAQPSRPGS